MLQIQLPWAGEAKCAGEPSIEFFPETPNRPKRALALCGICPVQKQCLYHALTFPEEYGVWGGMTERERERLRRQPRKFKETIARCKP